ncbi:hypothetical protein BN2497_7331 [Janthinobacterium sp. CG23_2]|nr:hypothetical protein BN2497_7331 [Janthinobacterium sp. CG23_2]CUU30063.1 hypothetical protein BN3177_7331 [Janthinobacterium sp. CG23_2]
MLLVKVVVNWFSKLPLKAIPVRKGRFRCRRRACVPGRFGRLTCRCVYRTIQQAKSYLFANENVFMIPCILCCNL